MNIETAIKWFERDPVEIEGKVYVFPHGAQYIKGFLRTLAGHAQTPGNVAPMLFDKCPDCQSEKMYAKAYDKCYQCGRNIG